jgi:hypothetical protein
MVEKEGLLNWEVKQDVLYQCDKEALLYRTHFGKTHLVLSEIQEQITPFADTIHGRNLIILLPVIIKTYTPGTLTAIILTGI